MADRTISHEAVKIASRFCADVFTSETSGSGAELDQLARPCEQHERSAEGSDHAESSHGACDFLAAASQRDTSGDGNEETSDEVGDNRGEDGSRGLIEGKTEGKDGCKNHGELPEDLLALCLVRLESFGDVANASLTCRAWHAAAVVSWRHRRRVDLSKRKASDGTLQRVVHLAWNVQELDLWGSVVTDDGLCCLSSSPCSTTLLSVVLWGNVFVTDKGVSSLVASCRSLRHINLGGTDISDEALRSIGHNCRELQALNLWGCRKVTDHGLLHISQKCKKLTTMNIWGVNISMTCLAQVLESLPKLNVTPSLSLPRRR